MGLILSNIHFIWLDEKFSVWLVTEKHLFHNDGRVTVMWKRAHRNMNKLVFHFISSGANTHKTHSPQTHTRNSSSQRNIHVSHSHPNRFELLSNVSFFRSNSVSHSSDCIYTRFQWEVTQLGMFVTKFSTSNLNCMLHIPTHVRTRIVECFSMQDKNMFSQL